MYISISYFLLLSVALILYYLFPIRYRWVVLLAGSIFFYIHEDIDGILFLCLMIVLSYGGSLIIEKMRSDCISKTKRKAGFILVIIMVLMPLIINRTLTVLIPISERRPSFISLLTSLGVSFYTLQMVAYLSDIYLDRTDACRNFFKYFLFISFFPQILQGPIPRYGLMDSLFDGHRFNPDNIVKGFQLIIWGVFLKLVIADRAGIFVDMIFNDPDRYQGCYVLMAGILYSVQLYADFSSCVCIARGSAEMFGIYLTDNFSRPYFADSIKDFWRRWHITLSRFLRDYVYIPLGGNRKGSFRKYLNIMITFLVSGVWHGGGLNYFFWGFLHGFYQIAGELLEPVNGFICRLLKFSGHTRLIRLFSIMATCFLSMTAWIIFRAESLKKGL
ncbi:MAG: hypothetical protein K6A90_05090, partial [Lachnospiraceae bacterium]|nr:hypothetical protein [Lachnospiraceae bacterium]